MQKFNTIDVSTLSKQQNKDKNIPKNLTKQQQIHLQNMFDESQLQNYFINAQGKIPFQTLQLAGLLYAQQGTNKITSQIKFGQLKIGDQQNNLDEDFLKQKISIQQQKAISLKLKKAQIQQKLKYLQIQTSQHMSNKNNRLNSSNPQLYQEMKPPNVFSKQQHQAYIQKIAKQRVQRDKKHKQIVEKLQKNIKQQEQKMKLAKNQKISKEIQQRKKQIQKNLQQRKQQHKKMLEQQMKSREQYKKIKTKQFLHEKIEMKYKNQILLPALQEKKKKLKQIREMSKAFNVQQLKKHQKQYVQRRNQSFSMVKSKVNEDWNYKPPEKKQRLVQMLQQQKVQQRKKLQQKKRHIDEKIQRQSDFLEYLKEKFQPKIDQNKQREVEQRIIYDSKPKRRESAIDSKTLGISYLQQAKRLKKVTLQRPQTEKYSEKSNQKASQKGMTDYLTINRKQRQYYQQKRRKRLQNLIKSQNPTPQKLKKLKQQSQKISEAYSRKYQLSKLKNQDINQHDDALQLLLSGIKAKMGIINVYKNKKEQQII